MAIETAFVSLSLVCEKRVGGEEGEGGRGSVNNRRKLELN